MPETPGPRFLTLDDVAEELAMTQNQVYALVRRGDLEGVKIGGRGQWRVERVKFEEYLTRTYEETRQYIKDHPYPEQEAGPGGKDEEPGRAEPAADRAAAPAEQRTAGTSSPVDPALDDVTALAAMANPRPPAAAVAGREAADTVGAVGAGGGGTDDRREAGQEI